ncbi:toll/interleukin-1 receptor domain-containing protein [Candidatus Entotheonella palauensis]|nr:toll/interleukin-1 receptor domain-containing protein [Candidatus Entotheonella palauensis]
MSNEYLWDVFLSYSGRDRIRVEWLAERLRETDLRVWFDEWVIKPGDDI